MELWYPSATREELPNAGAFTGGPPKGVLHTTEGKSYAGALAAYKANGTAPQFTVSPEGGKFRAWQHIPINRAGKALKNLAGGSETNRDHVIQIECVGTSDRRNANTWGHLYVEKWPMYFKAGLRELMKWIERNAGVRPVCGVLFKPYPESSGSSNGVRMWSKLWDGYAGWCGHQHVPENLHGDPGRIDIDYLLDRGTATVTDSDYSIAVYYNYIGGKRVASYPLRVPTDADGEGSVGIGPIDKFICLTAHAPNDKYNGSPDTTVYGDIGYRHGPDDQVFAVVENGPQNSEVWPWVTVAD